MSIESMSIVATGLPKTIEDYQLALNAAFAGGRAFGEAVMQGRAIKQAMAEANDKRLDAEKQEPVASWLEDAYREGWAACRDAEFVGEEEEDWQFGNSTANSRMIDLQQSSPPQRQPLTDEHAMFAAQHMFLEWNRAQDERLVKVAYEYSVFKVAIELYKEAAHGTKGNT